MRIPFLFVAGLCLCACVVPPREYPVTAPRTLPAGPAALGEPVRAEPAPSPESQLYARDGRAVDPNATEPPLQKAATRELQGGESSRSTILEWYQAALEERDRLQRENASLLADLAQARASLRAAQSEIASLTQRTVQLEGEKLAEAELNLELAGRLTTAQIRRLQAEKLLLETKLQQSLRLQEASAADAPSEKGEKGAGGEGQ
jgi:hypothetical protein